MLAEGKGAEGKGRRAMAWTSSPQEEGCICKRDLACGKGRVFRSLTSYPRLVCAGNLAAERGRCLRAQQKISRQAGGFR